MKGIEHTKCRGMSRKATWGSMSAGLVSSSVVLIHSSTVVKMQII